MSRWFTIALREFRSLWLTPLAWVLLTCFLLLQGGIFYAIVLHYATRGDLDPQGGPLAAYFGQNSLLLAITLLLLCPVLTMRSLAEERRTGSIELLLSAPVSSSAIVLGKYLATWSTYLLMWLPTLLYAVILRDTGTLDTGSLLTSYLGVLLVGSSYLALGVFASALARSQFIALLLSISMQFGFFILGLGEYVLDAGPLRELSSHLSLTTLLEETSRGVLDSRRLIFHSSVTLWALFVSTRLVESWRSE